MPIENLPQLVPSAVCLACDGCCRFSGPESAWRPRVGETERDGLLSAVAGQDSSPILDPAGYVTTVPDAPDCPCRFFHPPDHLCRIYDQRPLECRLYPFLLVRNGPDYAVAVHLACPFVQSVFGTPPFAAAVRDLEQTLTTPAARAFLSVNRALFGDYASDRDQLAEVFSLDGLTEEGPGERG